MPTFKQQIRFCTGHDGVRIAYATSGIGPPLIKAANWLSHLEFDVGSPVWSHLLIELSRQHTLIRYDERVREVAADYKHRFAQQSVLITELSLSTAHDEAKVIDASPRKVRIRSSSAPSSRLNSASRGADFR